MMRFLQCASVVGCLAMLAACSDDDDGNEEGPARVCEPNSASVCYTGPAATEGVGSCVGGTMTCNSWGTAWGPCTDEVTPAQEDCGVVGDEDCNGIPCSDIQWGVVAGGSGMEMALATAVGSNGNVVVAATLLGDWAMGSDTFSSPSSLDSVLLVFDSDGTYLWGKQVGDGASGTAAQAIQALTMAPNGDIIIAGMFLGSFDLGGPTLSSQNHADTFVARLDASGNHLWSWQLSCTACTTPSAGDKHLATVEMMGTNVVIAGGYQGQFGAALCLSGMCELPDTATVDPFVVLLTGNGDFLEVTHFESSSGAAITAAAVDSSGTGRLVVGGNFSNDHNVLPGESGGNWPAVGRTDMFVVGLDETLAPIWHRSIGTEAGDNLLALCVDADGNPVVVGTLEDPLRGNNLIIIKLPHDDTTLGGLGTLDYPLATRVFDSNPFANQLAMAASFDSNGELLIGGRLEGSLTFAGQTLVADGEGDAFVMKLDAEFDEVWAHLIGGSAADMAHDLALSPDDTIVVVGHTRGTIDFGAGPQPNGGETDLFITKLHP